MDSKSSIKSNKFTKIKWLIIFGLSLLALITIHYLNPTPLWNQMLTGIKEMGFWGFILFIAIYNIATLLFIPGSLLTMKGGCLYGVIWGTIYVSIAAILGAIFAFLLGRYFCRNWVLRKLDQYPKIKAIKKAVTQEGWKIVLLMRLSPLFPFNLLNYLLGITDISFRDYFIGSLGIFPGVFAYVYLGSLAVDLSSVNQSYYSDNNDHHIMFLILRIIGLIATLLLTVYLNKLAKKALKHNLENGEKNHVTINKKC
ncbi:TVP38/TMEM64 family protein [Cyanobacterium stanieri LEGE 03274]|uniref:TVP38/TMEM64 family membrane protein n=2 Tax=Cyanobacterium TaxID=102234 RepID=A0ABR9V3R1_9CHRO|nr:TVP38/TMEM64 family protein [Cyanobacterium stanieri LEGE 03274]